jgi:N-acetylmuramoyl-L-alanine amidase
VTLAGQIRLICAILALWLLLPVAAAFAQSANAARSMGGQAHVLEQGTALSVTREAVAFDLSLSQPVPYRLRLIGAPPRVVMDLNTISWGETDLQALADAQGLAGLRVGHLPDGWARLVLDLGGPFVISSSEQRIEAESGRAVITLRLRRTGLEEFEAAAWDEAQFLAQSVGDLLHPAARGAMAAVVARKPLVMLDPGHGGIDPGAERAGLREADLVLAFARHLREILLRRGVFDVAMTRDSDEFVSLDGRIRAARGASANVFVSLHADALPEGMASGAVMYLLGDAASDESAAYLAERHDRADMLAGVDLSGATDDIARVLMSVAWQDTQPRARALAEALVEGVGGAGLRLHRRPICGICARFCLSSAGCSALRSRAGLCHAGFGRCVLDVQSDLPSHEQLANYAPPSISRIYSGEGRLIDEFALERRLFTPIDDIPDQREERLYRAEDRNFYVHGGL